MIPTTLDVLRRQSFAEPLPMTAGKTIYDHVRETVKRIVLGAVAAILLFGREWRYAAAGGVASGLVVASLLAVTGILKVRAALGAFGDNASIDIAVHGAARDGRFDAVMVLLDRAAATVLA
mgnify:CR=1 FL=1